VAGHIFQARPVWIYTQSNITNNFVACCQQAIDNLLTSRGQAVRTHPDDKLWEQHCYKSATGLLQLVRLENYTRKNLASCSRTVNKLCSHCLSQVVNKYVTTC
jgi:hypothetical protein